MLLWLWLYNSDSFQMWPNLLVTFYYVDFFNVINRSPTSKSCHEHISSPTSVANINVALYLLGTNFGWGSKEAVINDLIYII